MQSAMIVLSFIVILLSWESACARPHALPCSIHPKKGTATADLPALTTISQAKAELIAVKSLKTAAAATVTEGELEIEHGCLVYSFDIRVAGIDGIEEIVVDAGTGKVLSRMHESTQQEAAENAKEQKSSEQHE